MNLSDHKSYDQNKDYLDTIQCGLLYVRTEDTSSILNRNNKLVPVLKLVSEDLQPWSYVGLCYRSGPTGSTNLSVILYNVYDLSKPEWLEDDSLLVLVSKAIISSIILRPWNLSKEIYETFCLHLVDMMTNPNPNSLNMLLENCKLAIPNIKYEVKLPIISREQFWAERDIVDSKKANNLIRQVPDDIIYQLLVCEKHLIKLLSRSGCLKTLSLEMQGNFLRLIGLMNQYQSIFSEFEINSISTKHDLSVIIPTKPLSTLELRQIISTLDGLNDPELNALQSLFMRQLARLVQPQ